MRALLVLLAAATACVAMPGPQSFSLSLPAARGSDQTKLGDKIHEVRLGLLSINCVVITAVMLKSMF